MYIIRLYNDDDILVDVIGEFEKYEEAEQWIKDYAKDNEYGIIIFSEEYKEKKKP